jgi:hypothetical protein
MWGLRQFSGLKIRKNFQPEKMYNVLMLRLRQPVSVPILNGGMAK